MVFEYLIPAPPWAQSSLPPSAGYSTMAADPTVYPLPIAANRPLSPAHTCHYGPDTHIPRGRGTYVGSCVM